MSDGTAVNSLSTEDQDEFAAVELIWEQVDNHYNTIIAVEDLVEEYTDDAA
jgi:hypothetical protein